MKTKNLLKGMVLFVSLLMLSLPTVSAQIDYCEGNFDYDQDQDGSDAFTFKEDFGRSTFGNPCPPDGPSLVSKTGQTGLHAIGDDAYFQAGVEWPNPRFTDNWDGTVTDTLTGLIWLKENNCFGQRTWGQALSDAYGLADGACGLSDASTAGNWRLPNVKELLSLIDYGNFSPALPSGHPFGYVQIAFYWSSTTAAYNAYPWCVNMYGGYSEPCGGGEITSWYVWPVRGGRIQMRFTDNGNGTVTDNTSALIWMKNADCFGWLNWYDAMTGTTLLESGQCGLTDRSLPGYWRMPTQAEWESFVCTQFTEPAVCNAVGTGKWTEGNPFSNVQSDMYWSEVSLDPDNAWAVLMGDGSGSFGHKSGSDGHVWPVRGHRFIDNGDGTVTDINSDLLWLKNIDCFAEMTWDDAMTTVSDLANGQCGLTDSSNPGDWRLPSKAEFDGFACPQFNDPALCDTTGMRKWQEGDPFYNMPHGFVHFWSSTTYESNPSQAYSMNIYLGFTNTTSKNDNSLYMWPVRIP